MLQAGGPFRSFEDVYEYIVEFTNYERMTNFRYCRDVLDLDRVRRVLKELGSPDRRYPIIHVAGTKGKGSVCAMAASILREAGLSVGLFSKPHLIRLNERVSVDGQDISDEHFVEMMNLLYPLLEAQRAEGNALTFFDLITVLALSYFARRRVDAVVLEVGLGGRLDSTNVVEPTVCVITTISFDHTHILGDTLAKIASEKAGIIKSGVPVISGVEDPEPRDVIRSAASEQDAPLIEYGRDFRLKLGEEPYGEFAVETSSSKYERLRLPLWGTHQRLNAAVAVAAVEAFSTRVKRPITEVEIRRGLEHVKLRGRVEVLSKQPWVILDVAHNPSSLEALRNTLEARLPSRRVVLLMGISRDKDVEGNLRAILPIASHAIFTGIGHPRGVEPEELKKMAQAIAPKLLCEAEDDIASAFERALELTGPEDVLCITGSFYLAGEVAALWERRDLSS